MGLISLPIRYYRYYPGDTPLGFTQTTIDIDGRHMALLLVDVYRAAEKQEARHLVNTTWDQHFWRVVKENIVPLLHAARGIGVPVIYVTNSAPRIAIDRSPYGQILLDHLGFDPRVDFQEPQVDPYEYHQGDPIQLIIPTEITPQPGDYVVKKHTYSGFFETRLDSVLRNLGIHTILCAGFVADVCMLFTVGDAVFRGYKTIFLRDCTLATELPSEVGDMEHTNRTILWIESFLAPSTLSSDFLRAVLPFGVDGEI